MKKAPSTLAKSVDILHSSLFFIVFACIIHVLFVTSTYKFDFPLLFLLLIILKLVIFSGFYGAVVELASGEQPGYAFKSIKKNIAQFFLIYTALTIGQLALETLIRHGVKQVFSLTVFPQFFNLDILLLAVFAFLIIRKKYINSFNISNRPIKVSLKQAGTLIVLYFLNIFVININIFYNFHNSNLDNFPILLSTYIHILTFLYLVFITLESYPEIHETIDRDTKLYLVSPVGGGVFYGICSQLFRGYPPVFVVLKALSPKHYKSKTFLRIPWKERFYAKDKLVAITCFTSNSPEAYKIAKEFKRRGSKVIMGGPHVTYLPDEALEFCDSVVIGEAEGVWKEVIRDFEAGALKPKYNGYSIEDFHSEVHKELLNSPPEVIKDFLETTRGCKYRCHFCTIPSLSGGKTRKKPIPELVELIEKIKHKYDTVLFLDNNIYSDPAYARELFKALKPLKIKWATQCTIDIAKNEETLRLAKESGCTQFLFGYEIFGGSNEKRQGGKFALEKQYINFTRKIKKAGIKIKAHFIYGFDSDNIPNALRLWFFCFRIRPLYTIISLLTPLPGSQLYHEMLQKNQITNYNWRYYNCHNLVYEPKQVAPPLMKVLFPLMKYTYFLTTSKVGYAILLFIIVDYIFFGLRHL